jgi:hypothetical protein
VECPYEENVFIEAYSAMSLRASIPFVTPDPGDTNSPYLGQAATNDYERYVRIL